MRFGKQLTISRAGTVSTITEEQYINWNTARRQVINQEVIKVKTREQIIGEFLKLLDRHDEGKIGNFGLYCVADEDGTISRIEKNEILKDLQA